jgi:hypothetical protein
MVQRNMALARTLNLRRFPMKFDPIAQWGQFFETWQQMAGDSFTRANTFFAALEKVEAQRVQRAEQAIEQIAQLQKETLAYGAQLSASFRKVSLEAFQKAATFNPSVAA